MGGSNIGLGKKNSFGTMFLPFSSRLKVGRPTERVGELPVAAVAVSTARPVFRAKEVTLRVSYLPLPPRRAWLGVRVGPCQPGVIS